MVDVVDSETNEQEEIAILCDNLPDENRTIMQKYIQQLDAAPVTTEEPLSSKQIVSVVNMEDEGDSDESEEEEILCVQIKRLD